MPERETFWTTPRLKKLDELYAMGLSASLIANGIGDGCSRSAVISKLRRLPNTSHRAPTIVSPNRGGPRKPRSRGGIARPSRPPPPPPPGPVIRLTLLQLEKHSCRWPLWDDKTIGDRLFCSAYAPGVEDNKPYCAKHTDIARSHRVY